MAVPEWMLLSGKVGKDMQVPVRNDGRSFLSVPLAMFSLFFVTVWLWVWIQYSYWILHNVAGSGAPGVYFSVDGGQSSRPAARVALVWGTVDGLAGQLDTYFMCGGVLSLTMCFRMFEYLVSCCPCVATGNLPCGLSTSKKNLQ